MNAMVRLPVLTAALGVDGNVIRIEGLDGMDETPVLNINPVTEQKNSDR